VAALTMRVGLSPRILCDLRRRMYVTRSPPPVSPLLGVRLSGATADARGSVPPSEVTLTSPPGFPLWVRCDLRTMESCRG